MARIWEKVNTKEEERKSPEKKKRKQCTKWRRYRQPKVSVEKVSQRLDKLFANSSRMLSEKPHIQSGLKMGNHYVLERK